MINAVHTDIQLFFKPKECCIICFEWNLYLMRLCASIIVNVNNVRLHDQAKTMKELIGEHITGLFDVIEKTYSRLYGTMPLNREIIDNYVKDFKLIVRPQDVLMIMDKTDRIVGFALLFPSISDAVRKSHGHITLPFLVRFLRSKYHPRVLDLGLIGILPEYESKGVVTMMIGLLIQFLKSSDIDHLETNLMLEDNHHIQNLMKHFDKRQNKRRRCFRKEIGID